MKLKLLTSVLCLTAVSAFAQSAPSPTKLVAEVKNDENERLLSDNFQRTLYTFDVDKGSNTSKCVGDCAEVWPALIVSAPEAATLQAPLGTITRANKKLQLTYLGAPVYTYAFDRQVGDDKGDGIGGVWHYVELK